MIECRKLGSISYENAWELQHELVNQRSKNEICDTLLVLEHPHVYTLGRKTPGVAEIEARGEKEWFGVPLFIVERGGEVTYHGPGQLILYPIFLLSEKIGPKAFLRVLENAIIATLAKFNLDGFFIENSTGVWLKDRNNQDRKIASLGISVRQGVSYHGLALNICTDLSYFKKVSPCGFAGTVMTSMEEIFKGNKLHEKIDSNKVSEILSKEVILHFQKVLLKEQK